MDWYKGSVSEAIKEAKTSDRIFIVYIYDKGEASKSLSNSLEKEEINKFLQPSKYIAIQLENGSSDAIMFAQIYPLIVVPSIFFISPQNGVPLEIVGGGCDSEHLLGKIKKIFNSEAQTETENNKDSINNQDIVSPPAAISNSTEKEKQSEDTQTNNDSDAAENAGTSQEINSDDNSTSFSPHLNEASGSTEPNSSNNRDVVHEEDAKNLDERISKAKELLQQNQETKAVKEIEEEKQKELERRRQSKEVVKAKQKREEQELYEQTLQRKKDKEEERLARERVKAQIAADRAERQARNALLRGEQPQIIQENAPSSANAPLPVNQNRNVTRIKFRFPDNSSQLAQFSPETTLQDVKSHLIENVTLPFSNFKMVGTLPPRTFTENDMPLTLMELGLTPSAIIIVKPIASSSSPASLVPSQDGMFLSFIWMLFAPFSFIFNYFRGFLGGRRNPTPSPNSSEEGGAKAAKIPRTEENFSTNNRPKSTYGRRNDGAFLRREGNIHRLNRGNDDDEEDNNTWNGNSTQQM